MNTRPLAIVPFALTLSLGFASIAQTTPSDTPTSTEPRAPKVVVGDSDARVDSDTGRAKVTWPTSRLFDQIHMKLSLNFPDMNEAKLTGVQELTVRALGEPRSVLILDCNGPQVSEVTVGDAPVEFELADKRLSIHLAQPAKLDEDVTVKIHYEAEFSKNRGDGLTWIKPRSAEGENSEVSPTQTSPQVYSQGEAQSNCTWFPCHDFPNDRLTTELVVTVEDGYEVLSNGTLVSKESGGDAGEGRTTYHWKQDQTHAVYLVALYIAKCSVVELGGPDSARPGLPIPVYCPIGSEEMVRDSMRNVPAMIAFFERYFGQAFPWDKYAEALIRGFNGGMENSSATFLMLPSVRRGMHDDLLSHELAHQWTGDLVTCNSWEHIWLNEGWASFAEALWDEEAAREANAGKSDADEIAREAYEKVILADIRKQRARNRGNSPGSPAMVSNRYVNPDTVFMKPDDPYAKGASILHMLREKLGRETFDRGVRLYMERFKWKTAETSDFRRVMEEVSGQSLEQFFEQWCYRPGIPRLSVNHSFDAASKTLAVTVEQIQKIDGYNPAYVLDVPIRVPLDGGGEQWLTVHCDRTSSTASVVLPGVPLDLEVDPNLTLLSSLTVHKPTAMWKRQWRDGSTYFARGEAAEHIGSETVANATLAFARSVGGTLQRGVVLGFGRWQSHLDQREAR